MKILTWRQYINASTRIVCKQKCLTFFLCFSFLSRPWITAMLVCFDTRSDAQINAKHGYLKMADVTVASELTVWSKRLLWFIVLYGVLIWNSTKLTKSAQLYEKKQNDQNVAFLKLSILTNHQLLTYKENGQFASMIWILRFPPTVDPMEWVTPVKHRLDFGYLKLMMNNFA